MQNYNRCSMLHIQRSVIGSDKLLIAFSGGKDSIAASHVWLESGLTNVVWVYFYFVEGLSFVEPILNWYQSKWGITIFRLPCFERKSLLAKRSKDRKKAYSQKDDFLAARNEFQCQWLLSGAKRADSLARRGMLKSTENGIDYAHRVVYPIIDWSDKQVFTYCNFHKLVLPITYKMGIGRSLWVPTVQTLLWMRVHFNSDYELIINEFPELEIAVWREDQRWK